MSEQPNENNDVPEQENYHVLPGQYAMAYPLKEGEIFVAGVEVVGLMLADGSLAYRVRSSDGPVTQRVGLLEMAKMQLFLENRPRD